MPTYTDHQVAPFTYYGGKRRITELVWSRLGDTPNYVEPFCGSAVMLLKRPPTQLERRVTETINDYNGWLTNAWRAIKYRPKATARLCDWPVSELDLHSRGDAIFYRHNEVRELCDGMGYSKHCPYRDACPCQRGNFVEWQRAKCTHTCPAMGGLWVWGACCWIGDWQAAAHNAKRDNGVAVGTARQLPRLSDAGNGINRKLPELMPRGQAIREYFQALSARLRDVRVVCGDWKRVLKSSVTTQRGLTAVFLDPPYGADGYDTHVYGTATDKSISRDVLAWCAEHGNDPKLRIAVCGYTGEYDALGWEQVAWKAAGGYANQRKNGVNENRKRERVWFSPHCLPNEKAPAAMGGLV